MTDPMDKNESYFRRSFWFVWIGYVTSLVAFLAIGSVGTLAPKDRLLQIQDGHWMAAGSVALAAAIASHFLFQSIQRLLVTSTNFSSANGQNVEKQVGQTGMALVQYVVLLSLIEIPALMGFVMGFLGAEFQFMVPFLGIALALQTLALPSRCLPRP